jgi:hypothetical protein
MPGYELRDPQGNHWGTYKTLEGAERVAQDLISSGRRVFIDIYVPATTKERLNGQTHGALVKHIR